MKQRIKYYDLLRIISFCMVVFYHMMIQLQLNGICAAETVSPFFVNGNMHIATMGVALFFMLSGAGLTISADRAFSVKKYYLGRFIRLLIPFYLAVLLYYVLSLVIYRTMPTPFHAGLPAWKYIFTLAGVDEWVSMHGYSTFSCSIGEWFLGALIILTVLFPVFRFLMNRWPRVFLTVCMTGYVYVIYNYTSTVPVHMNLLIKGFEFVLGMYLGRFGRKISKKMVMLAVPVAVFFFTSKTALNINNALKITVSALAVFVAMSGLESVLQKRPLKILEGINRYSYPLFLVHHFVIYFLTPKFAAYYSGRLSVFVFFVIELVVIVILTVLLKVLSDLVSNRVRKLLIPAAEK